jgi:transposase
MRPTGTKQSLEVRRRTAVLLRKQGLTVRTVAERVGSVPSSVVRWEKAFDRQGERGLDSKPQAGGKARLTKKQLARLTRQLIAGPRVAGWHNELWTLSRVAQLIERTFGITYHISHVHRLLRQIGFSAQKPTRFARERNDEAIAHFQKKQWPAIKKSPARGKNHRSRR